MKRNYRLFGSGMGSVEYFRIHGFFLYLYRNEFYSINSAWDQGGGGARRRRGGPRRRRQWGHGGGGGGRRPHPGGGLSGGGGARRYLYASSGPPSSPIGEIRFWIFNPDLAIIKKNLIRIRKKILIRLSCAISCKTTLSFKITPF